MKVSTLIELLEEFDGDRTVVIPWSIPKTAREAAEVREVKMAVTAEEDFIPLHDDERHATQSETVVALVPVMREPYERREQEKAERQQKQEEARDR